MKRIWFLMLKAVKGFDPKARLDYWILPRDRIALRAEKWFGYPFWFGVALFAFTIPGFQVLLLCAAKLPASVRGIMAAIDLLAMFALLYLLFVITSFGAHKLTAPQLLLNFFRRLYPKVYKEIGTAASLYRNPVVSVSQKRNVLVELTTTPYTVRIFRKYIIRVVLVTLAIPVYLGLSLLSLGILPHQHRVGESTGHVSVIHALEVLRDLQMGVLGGTSTEHLHSVNDANVTESAVWEIALAFSTFLYVMLMMILLPLQIGIVGNLDRHLKSQGFWKRELRTWPES